MSYKKYITIYKLRNKQTSKHIKTHTHTDTHTHTHTHTVGT